MFTIILQILFFIWTFFMFRILYVHEARSAKLRECCRKAENLQDMGIDDWDSAFREYESVSFEEMVVKFWIWPVSKMWKKL